MGLERFKPILGVGISTDYTTNSEWPLAPVLCLQEDDSDRSDKSLEIYLKYPLPSYEPHGLQEPKHDRKRLESDTAASKPSFIKGSHYELQSPSEGPPGKYPSTT